MTLYNFEALEASPGATETLTVLAAAMGEKIVAQNRRVPATPDSRSPDEGLALLNAYITIHDRGVRQAILDMVLAISGVDPYR